MSRAKPIELAGLADCSRANVSKALRAGRIERDDEGLIDLSDEKTKLFIASCIAAKEAKRAKELESIKTVTTKINGTNGEQPAEYNDAIQRYLDARAEKEEQNVEKLKLANATRRAQLFEAQLVNQYLMTLYDRTRNANKREFADFIGGFITDIQEGRKSRNELKRKAMQIFDEWHYDAVHELANEIEKLEEIQSE